MTEETVSTKPAIEVITTSDGQSIPIDEVERVMGCIWGVPSPLEEKRRLLWLFSWKCLLIRSLPAARSYGQMALKMERDPEPRAEGILRMAMISEKEGKFAEAAEVYKESLKLSQWDEEALWFLNNDLGNCLNKLGQHEEAEGYCRAAISIYPQEHKAHKNLGVSLAGRGRYVEAAENYLKAIELGPQDPQALDLLRAMVAEHAEVLRREEGLWGAVEARLGERESLAEETTS